MTAKLTRIRSLRAASIAAICLLLIVAASAGAAAESADDEARLDEPALSGRVFTWNAGVLRVIEGASVSTGIVELQTDANGRFEFTPEQRSGSLSVVKPGFDVVRRTIYGDSIGIILRELVVRAVYVPFGESAKPQVQAWIRSLIERDLINAVVMDVKSEGGQVLSFASTPTADRIGATRWDDGSRAFFEELGEKGVYRIGRVVTFLDDRYSAWHPRTALQHVDGERFLDGAGLGWSSPFDAAARRYNVEIGVAAAECVDEVQFDYVRLPYENGLVERFKHGAEARSAAINTFAAEAAEALHLAGAAISFDVFGVIAISSGRRRDRPDPRRPLHPPRLRLADALPQRLGQGLVRPELSARRSGTRDSPQHGRHVGPAGAGITRRGAPLATGLLRLSGATPGLHRRARDRSDRRGRADRWLRLHALGPESRLPARLAGTGRKPRLVTALRRVWQLAGC